MEQTIRIHSRPQSLQYLPTVLVHHSIGLHCKLQGPVVQSIDDATHRINHYPVDSVVCFVNTYPLDSDCG